MLLDLLILSDNSSALQQYKRVMTNIYHLVFSCVQKHWRQWR